MDIYPIKAGFSGGVISAAATGRVNTESYVNGMLECKNWTVTPQGSLRKRRGARYIENLREDASAIRLIRFPVNVGADVVVVLDGVNVTLHDRAGIVEGGGLFGFDPYFSGGEQYWKKTGVASLFAETTYEGGFRVLFQHYRLAPGGSAASIGVQQKIFGPADTYKINFGYASQAGVASSVNSEVSKNYAAVSGQVFIGTGPGLSDIASMEIAPANWNNPTFDELTFVTTGAPFYVTLRTKPTIVPGYNDNTGAFYGPILINSTTALPQSFASPWDDTEVRDIQVATDISTGEMFLVHPQVPPQLLRYNYVTRAWTFGVITFTSPPAEWVSGNYPSVVEIFQSRLWFGATPLQANTIWASKVASYLDFTPGATASDPIDISLASAGTILWLLGMQQMLIGTADGEIMLGAESGTITGSSFYLYRQNGYSSAGIQAAFVGRQIAYVGAGRGKVRVSQLSEEARGMMGSDITVVASELFLSGIKEVHYAVEPEYLLYCVLEDGTVAACTYDLQNELLAWHTMEVTDFSNGVGEISSIALTQESGGQAVWMAIRRAGQFTLELIEPELFTRRFLDSYEYKSIEVFQRRAGAFSLAFSSAFSGGYVASQTTQGISGLDRLNGVTVGIVLENADTGGGAVLYEVLPDQPVSNGIVYVPNGKLGFCVVGLNYMASATTLPQEGGSNAGTAQGSKRKWNRIFARLALSAIPTLNGYRPAVPAALVPSSGNPLDADVSGDFEVRNEGFDEGVVVIEQNLPLRTEIAGIFGKSQSNAV